MSEKRFDASMSRAKFGGTPDVWFCPLGKLMQARHEDKYDMLRGLAAIAVLIPHIAQTFLYRLIGDDNPFAMVTGTVARHAVLIFFLLSGFLITLSMGSNIRRNGRLDVSEYLSARIARIYPPLIGAIAIVLLACAIIMGLGLPGSIRYGLPGDLSAVRDHFSVHAKDIVLALLMQKGLLDADGPLWSLYFEFHLYIIAMFVALATTSKSSTHRAIHAVVALALAGLWTAQEKQFVFYMVVWSLGAAVSIWREKLMAVATRRVFATLVWIVAIAFVATLILAPRYLVVDHPSVAISFCIQFAICIAYVYFIFLVDWGSSPARWLVRSGDFSYSLYVIHFPLLLLVLSLTQTWMGMSLSRAILVSAAAALAVVAISIVFARFFENQRRFKPRIRRAVNAISRIGRSAPSTP